MNKELKIHQAQIKANDTNALDQDTDRELDDFDSGEFNHALQRNALALQVEQINDNSDLIALDSKQDKKQEEVDDGRNLFLSGDL